METKVLEREEIILAITETLRSLDYVNAMWQCGSAAFKRVDEWSDIDIAVDVDDDRVMDIFPIIDKLLESIAPIELCLGYPQSMSPGGYQKVYRLKGISRFMVVELCAVKHSSKEKFIQREIHGDILVRFDKGNVTESIPLDKEMFNEVLKARIDMLDKLFNIYQFLIEKELNRNNNIEALAFYQNFSLAPLVEVLRMKYNPYRYSFRARYVYYDLPKEVVEKLEKFYFVTDNKDLHDKHQEIIVWFNEVVGELKNIDKIAK